MTINSLYFFLTFLVIAISGNPAITVLGKETVYIGSLIIFLILWLLRPKRLIRQDKQILSAFGLLVALHIMTFGVLVVPASLGFLIKLGIALLSIRLIPEFSRRYVSVMYLLSIISFVFFIPLFLGVDMQGLFGGMRFPLPSNSIHYHIGLHNLREEFDGPIRNMGMFWEPGAFAGYLILALFFLIRDGQAKDIILRQGLVLIATLLSTQSTTGYVAFMVLAVFYVLEAGWLRSRLGKWVILPLFPIIFISASVALFSQASFLGEKIKAQIESALYRDDASRINRFGNFLYDIEWISERPILGWSANPETRVTSDSEVLELVSGQGNGLTGFAVKFGLTGLGLFLGFFANSMRRIFGSTRIAIFGVAIVCVLLNGEQFLGFPLFLSLMFLPQDESENLVHNTLLRTQ